MLVPYQKPGLTWAICAVVLWATVARCADEEAGTEQFYSGNSLYNKKLYPLAIAEYKAFLKKYPKHSKVPEARLGLALSLYAGGNYKEAEPLIVEILAGGKLGDKTELTMMRAHCALMQDKFDEAEKVFMQAIAGKLDKVHKVNALAGLAEAAFRRKDWKQSVERAEKLIAAQPDPALLSQVAYQAGYALYELKKYAEAATMLGKMGELAKEHPLLPRAAYLRAECYRESGKLAEAAEQYVKAAEVMTGQAAAEVYYRLGYVGFQQQKYDDAIAAFGKSLKAHGQGPMAAQCNLFIGRAYLEKKDYNRNRQYLEGLSRGNSASAPAACLWLARAYSRQGKHREAAGILGQALQRFRNTASGPDLLFDHANALVAQKKFTDAAKSLGSVLDKKDWAQRNDVLRLYSVCLHRSGDYKNSLKHAEEFITNYKDDKNLPEVLFVRGESLYLLGELDKSLAALKTYLDKAPGHANADAAIFRTTQALHKQGKWREAIKTAAPILKKNPQDEFFAQLKFVVGECHFRLSGWHAAIGLLKTFDREAARRYEVRRRQNRHEQDPNLDTALLELGVASLGIGDSGAAAGYFGRVVQHHGRSKHMPMALAELGRLQYQAKNNRGARATFDRFLREHAQAPQRAQVEYYYGWVSLTDKRDDEAAGHFGVVTKSYPKSRFAADAALQQGLIYEAKGKYKEAQAVFEALVKTYPNHQNMDLVLFTLGVTQARQKDWENAKKHFTKVTKDFPRAKIGDRAVYELAWCEKALGNRAGAVKHYEYLLDRYPRSDLVIKVKRELAEEKFATKDYDKVITGLKEALAKLTDNKEREQTLYRLGTAYFNNGDHGDSAETFELFLKKYSHSKLRSSAYFQAGESRFEKKDLDTARSHYRAAAQSQDHKIREPALYRLGQTEALRKDWGESEKAFGQFLQHYSKSEWATQAHFGLARAREERRNFDWALREFQQVVGAGRKDSMAAEAQYRAGTCLKELKKYDEALQALVRVQVGYGFKEWSAKALFEMGVVLEKKGEKARAIEQFQEVVKQFPEEKVADSAKERLKALGPKG